MAKDQQIYLDQATGQYYTLTTPQVPTYGMNNAFGWNQGLGAIYGMMGGYNPTPVRKDTGDISMVWKALQNQTPYQYNVPSIASMFPSLIMPSMNNSQPTQYTGGAGQFLGGLLGSGAPQASQQTSSGAGRFV